MTQKKNNSKDNFLDTNKIFDQVLQMADLSTELPFFNTWTIYIFFWINVITSIILMILLQQKTNLMIIYIILIVQIGIQYWLAQKMLHIDLFKRVNQKSRFKK